MAPLGIFAPGLITGTCCFMGLGVIGTLVAVFVVAKETS